MGYVILLWHSLSLPYNYYARFVYLARISGFEALWEIRVVKDKRDSFFQIIMIYLQLT